MTKAPYTDEMYALDTIIQFTVYEDENNAKAAVDKAKEEITRLENLLSVSKESDISKTNNSNGDKVKIEDETSKIIKKSIEISKSTDGAFDVSIYPLVKLWGFDTKKFKVPTDTEIEKTKKLVNYKEIDLDDDNIKINPDMQIDLGGIAKGYIADRAKEVLIENNIDSAIINAGGNVVTIGSKEKNKDFKIGIQTPFDDKSYFATISISDLSAVTSGPYQRYFEENGKVYHHILNPKTGYPADNDISSVTIISSDSTLADGYSTAFFVMGIDKIIEFYNDNKLFDFVILDKDMKNVYITSSISDKVEFEKDLNINIIK